MRRISLRALFLVVAFLAVLLAVEARRLHRQRAVVAWVERHGGVALYDWQLDADGQWVSMNPPHPRWLRLLIGPDYLQTVKAVDIFNARLTDISPLAELTELEYLNLNGNAISDLTPLKELTSLHTVHLAYNRIADVSPLRELTNLETLMLDENQVHNLEPLRSVTSLVTLRAADNRIVDIAPLLELPNLQVAMLARNSISHVAALQPSETLRILDLRENPLSEGNVATLRRSLFVRCQVIVDKLHE